MAQNRIAIYTILTRVVTSYTRINNRIAQVKSLRIIFFFTLLLAGPQLFAADTPAVPPAPAPNWYDVEIIVFRNSDPQAGVLESWPADPGTPDWNAAVPLKPTVGDLAYQLPASSYRLDSSWRKLSRSSDYTPLLQLAWAQPAIDRASAQFVRIGAPPTVAPAASSDAAAVISAQPPAAADSVYGVAKLSTTGLYLHFDLDLLYCGPLAKNVIPAAAGALAPTTGTSTTATRSTPACQPYRLRQDRKLDAGKVNYFDNPMFGALVLVTPRAK